MREREGAKKLCFSWLQTKIIFIRNAAREKEIVFQFFFEKQPIEYKPDFLIEFFCEKCSATTLTLHL